jgi:hypothetical protein
MQGLWLSRAAACPYCRADATGLADQSPQAAQDTAGLSFSGGIDVPSAYYFRGYRQADQGLILQPYLNIFTACPCGDVIVRPYVSLFHSRHFDSDNPMADMSDVMVGTVASDSAWSLDARYAYFTMNQFMRSSVHELGAKLSYDLLSLCREPGAVSPLALRPFAGAYFDLFDEEGTEDIFLTVGLEPAWRWELAGQKIGMSLPIEWGLSGDDYYLQSDGSNDFFGYFSATLTTSVVLPVPAACGRWFLNASGQYLHLAADSVRAVSGGDTDVWIGKLGFSFVY